MMTQRTGSRLGTLEILMLSAWCGLAGGLLEVGTRVLCRAIDPTKRLYFMSRHFVWLTPLANLVVFLGVGFCLAGLTRIWPRLGAWLSPRFLCALAILPVLIVANPRIYPEASLILALGIACAVGCLAGAVPGLHASPAGLEFSGSGGIGNDCRRFRIRWRLAQATARIRPRTAAGRFAERPLHRPGHGAGRSIESLWLPSSHDPDARAFGPTRHSFR